jgi:hypothetical protein
MKLKELFGWNLSERRSARRDRRRYANDMHLLRVDPQLVAGGFECSENQDRRAGDGLRSGRQIAADEAMLTIVVGAFKPFVQRERQAAGGGQKTCKKQK